MYKESKLTNVYCVFDLPFHLAVPDTEINTQGRAQEIYIEKPIPTLVSVKSETNSSRGIAIHGDIAEGDPYGRVKYSKLQVRFSKKAYPKLREWTDNILISESVGITNYIIDIYRDVYDRPLLHTLSEFDIVNFNVIFERENEEPFNRIVARPRGPARMGFNDQAWEQFDRLRSRLMGVREVDFLRMLDLETRRYFYLLDFKMAVISSATLFEAFIKRAIHQVLSANGTSPDEISKYFQDKNNRPKSITALVSNVVPDLLGKSFMDTTIGKSWASDCRDVRNDLIHGTRTDIDKTTARAALDASYAAVNYLE